MSLPEWAGWLIAGGAGAATNDLLRRASWGLGHRRGVKVTRIDPTEVPLRDLRPMRTALVLDDGSRLLVTRVEYRQHPDGHGVTIEAADEQHLMRQHGIVVEGPGS